MDFGWDCFALTTILAGCGESMTANDATTVQQKQYKWKLVSWPKNFPGLGRQTETFAQYVNEMSNGRLQIKVFGAYEIVPGLEVFDAVSEGTAEMGHAAAYYWKGKCLPLRFLLQFLLV